MIDIHDLILIFKVGLPIWILTGGGLLCLIVDSLLSNKGRDLVYTLGVASLLLSLWFAFKQWVAGQNTLQNLILSDRLTQFFIVLVLFIGLMSLLNLYSYLKVGGGSAGESTKLLSRAVVPLILFSVVGMIFLFASDHLIVNFLGLEIMSLAIYVLVGSNRKDALSNEAAMKYFVTGSVASAILLYGIALLYGSSETFQLSAMMAHTPIRFPIFLPKIGFILLLTGLFFKLGVAPFHFWVPDVYEGAPSPVTGFMSTGVKVASFALFIRILSTLHYVPGTLMFELLSVGVILTLLVGNLGAILQNNVKRMLAYSSIAHAGYLLLGLLVGFNAQGQFDSQITSAVLFYLMGYSFMTLGAFAVLSVMVQEKKEVTQFSDLTGLGYSHPYLAAVFSVFMLSLLGLPPTVGFIAKYGIFSYAVQNGYIGLTIFGVIMSLVSAYYYLRAIVVMYFRGSTTKAPISQIPLPLMFTLVFCVVSVIYLGFKPTEYIQMAQLAVQVLK